MAFEKKYGSRAEVFHGTAEMTGPSGLAKRDLVLKDGRIASKRAVAAAKCNPALKKWRKAVDQAKKMMGLEKNQMTLIKGKLLEEARKIYKKM